MLSVASPSFLGIGCKFLSPRAARERRRARESVRPGLETGKEREAGPKVRRRAAAVMGVRHREESAD